MDYKMIDWNSLRLEGRFKAQSKSFCVYAADKTPVGKALIFGLSRSLAEPVCHIVLIAESAFKGLAHLFGFPFSDKFKAQKAYDYLGYNCCVGIPALVLLVLRMPYTFFYSTCNYDPNSTCKLLDY